MVFIFGLGNTLRLYQNEMYDFTNIAGHTTSTNVPLKAINLELCKTNFIYNNYISDLKTVSATNPHAISGIYYASYPSTGSVCNLINNTVYLNASSTGENFGSTAVYCHPLTYQLTFLMQNNILVNTSVANGTGKTVVYQRSDVVLVSHSQLSNRNCLYAGTPGAKNLLFQAGYNNLQTISEFTAHFTGGSTDREKLSFTEMPPFVNIATPPYDLRLQQGALSKCESGGMVSVYNDEIFNKKDFDGESRFPEVGYPELTAHPAKAPDVGADEFAGIHLDEVPPTIQYDILSNTASTDPRTLVATITDDFSGIPVSGIGLPMLYWQKSTNTTPSGSWIGVQGVPLGSNQYSFTFGEGVQDKDYVHYFVAAQDLAPTPNIKASLNDRGNLTGLSANPPACASPDTYYFYQVVSVCGTFTVGAGRDFEKIRDAIEYLSNKEVTCPVVFLLTDELYYEDFYLSEVPGMSAANTITIKPAQGVTVRIYAYSSFATILFGDGASHYIIDGSNQTNGTDRNLTLENGGDSQVILMRQFSSYTKTIGNNTIKNCIIKGSGENPDYWSAGIVSPGAIIDGLNIENNELHTLNQGIRITGNESSVQRNVIIKGNILGNETNAISYYGINTSFTQNMNITENKITNIKNIDDNALGIFVGTGTKNAVISGNSVTGVAHTADDGYGGKGIDINTGDAQSNIMVFNNAISDITGDGYNKLTNDAITGIRVQNTGNVKLYHNSVHLFGDITGNYANPKSSAIYIGTTVADISIQNNIFVNSINDLTQTAKAYAIYSDAPAAAFTVIDNNDYYASGHEGILGYLGSDKSTLDDWKTATGSDLNSVSFMPPFVSNTDLRLTASNNAGIFIPEILFDLDGAARDTSTPDIGAFEKSGTDDTNNISADAENIRIFTVNRKILVLSDLTNSKVSVYNIAGQQIATANLNQGVFSEIPVEKSGIYIVSVKSAKGITTSKVICK